MGKNGPIHEIRLGRIRAAIWQNETADGESWFKVTASRLYKDQGSKWQDSDSFRRDDLPIVCKALDMAYEWIWQQNMAAESETASE